MARSTPSPRPERSSTPLGDTVRRFGWLRPSGGVDLPVAASPAVLMRFDVRTLVSCPDNDLQRSARATLQRLKRTFTGARDVRPVEARIGVRPMPVDGLPIIGLLPDRPGGFVAVMHSAVTFAPVAGRLVAAEVVDGLDTGT